MAEKPWLTIFGLGEDGPDGLPPASREALAAAEVVMGPERHLGLVDTGKAERVVWPVPFADGIERLRGLRGRNVAVLASGDPFWFGAGAVIAREFDAGEWRALPGRSTFSLAANRLGWALEATTCLGLHAIPVTRLRPHLAPGRCALVLVRDGAAAVDLARWVTEQGFGDTLVHVLEALGGPRERYRRARAAEMDFDDICHPVALGLDVSGGGEVVTLASGRADELFEHDGQITKRPARALTLSALAPRPGEHLWDVGGGSGSVAIEWLLAHPSMRATVVEVDKGRAARIGRNADALGVDRLQVVERQAPDELEGLARPDAVFIGGGLSQKMLEALVQLCPRGCRLVANAVTLESEALLARWHADRGGELMRIALSHAAPLGSKRGWSGAYPIVQWSVEL